ncbi:hypothetical protein VE03_08161 [Pseudogymnoascus sp. 23342-1-I1]|nr:hypothetical protein VE03_08161 [Pseudogymnoascus sp. 23342-1-I1]
MALPLPAGLTPAETAFLCENEPITVIPRQRMQSIELLSGPTPQLNPPRPTTLPLWLALLLHRQNRATLVPPPWLTAAGLETILAAELASEEFCDMLPFHWVEIAQALVSGGCLGGEEAVVGRLVRGVREVRGGKVRGFVVAGEGEGGGVVGKGGVRGVGSVGAWEVGEVRGVVAGVVGGLARLGGGREAEGRREEEEDEEDGGGIEMGEGF